MSRFIRSTSVFPRSNESACLVSTRNVKTCRNFLWGNLNFVSGYLQDLIFFFLMESNGFLHCCLIIIRNVNAFSFAEFRSRSFFGVNSDTLIRFLVLFCLNLDLKL